MVESSLAARLVLGATSSTALTPFEIKAFERYDFAGVTLFKRNVSRTFRELNLNLKQLKPDGIIAIDQEGGRVSRLKGMVEDQGPAMDLADKGCSANALGVITDYASKLADELSGLGINVNFAPVVDVLSNQDNDAIGDRCFSTEPNSAALRAQAFLGGLQNSGKVFGCLKHFPGQGNAKADTHLESYSIDDERGCLMERDVGAFVPMLPMAQLVMMSHCIYPAFDQVQATLSKKIMLDLLRQDLGYDGLILSDDMNMKAIAQDEESWKEAIVEAIVHGSNLILVCENIDKSILAAEKISQVSKKSKAFTQKVEDSLQRLKAFHEQLAPQPLG